MKRRDFLAQTAVTAGLSIGLQSTRANALANDRITIAMIGVRGRGNAVLKAFTDNPKVDVKYICDVDESVLGRRKNELVERTGRPTEAVKDFRKCIDDPAVDAIVLATPTHWHAIPTIMACQAGKDVYVEKPDAHNAMEGRLMVKAAKQNERIIQLGTQSRSGNFFQNMVRYMESGKIGRPLFAKAWESCRQGSLGHPADSPTPAGVNYDMWLGPAPKRPFNPMRFHGNWRWFFDYGAGDLGNDGVHRLDTTRWAFEAALKGANQPELGPLQAISAHGAKCYFDDIQEWPDNLMITYDYGQGRIMTYEMRLWSPYPLENETEGGAVYGDQGYVIIGNNRWRAFGKGGNLLKEESGSYHDNNNAHVNNFLDCMRDRNKPNADLETIGHPSSLMCHLGNAAWRAGRTIRFDADSYTCIEDSEANQFLSREEYRKPWVLPNG
ncbi:MAG: Gfo/Idh/MocA family oxidoreductase [Planctomycetaceae bacterium]|nr:Gfo/Idh/MocA family oxidoreductase [Planctomycetaceae bacterium]